MAMIPDGSGVVKSDPAQTAEFLAAVYGRLPDGARSYLSSRHPADDRLASSWFSTVDEAFRYAVALARLGRDIWAPIAFTFDKDDRSDRRIMANNAHGVVAFVADVDYQHPVHKKPGLPPNYESALQLIHELPLEATFIIHFGHGVQGWWLFREPWRFFDNADRKQVMMLSERWGRTVQNATWSHGWKIDSVHDLSRIMRLPGSVNYKSVSKPLPTITVEQFGSAYSVADADRESAPLPADGRREPISSGPPATVRAGQRVWKVGDLVIDLDACAPDSWFLFLTNGDWKDIATWEGTRRDLPDQSQSGYDMAIAQRCIKLGLTDQQTVDTMIERRRMMQTRYIEAGLPLRPLDTIAGNPGKIVSTIAKVRRELGR